MGILIRNRKSYTGKIKEQPIYSTDEICIGYIDINGTRKKLYQKTYTGTFGTLTKNALTSISIDTVTTSHRLQSSTGWVNHANGRVPIPYVFARPTVEQVFLVQQVFASGFYLSYYVNSTAYDNCDWQVTLQYTKD